VDITKEPSLLWIGKEREADILADTMSLPFQEIRIFGLPKGSEWVNMLIFGDNLQSLKYLLKLKMDGKLKNPDGSDGIKLIYIDPPFATRQDFEGSKEQRAYSDKLADAEFLEFLRKRLILLRELLTEDGSIFLHLDYRSVHPVKMLMDEIFNKNNLINEIIYAYRIQGISRSSYARKHQTILWYSKNPNYIFKTERERVYYEKPFMDTPIEKREKTFKDLSNKEKQKVRRLLEKGQVLPDKYKGILFNKYYSDVLVRDVWDSDYTKPFISGSKEYLGFPTQKSEGLLSRIITNGSNEGDIILDCFAGSGTTGAVAEKLKRKWIMCDISKFSIYVIQKRLLKLTEEIGTNGKPMKHKPFVIFNAGLYDYKLIEKLGEKDYVEFVLNLFQVDKQNFRINGLDFQGKLFGQPVKVFDRKGFLTEKYIEDLHETVKNSISDSVFIICPATNVEFIRTSVDIDGKRYYILKIPYSIIDELHSKKFKRFQQPNSKSKINEIVDTIGFDFIYPPEIKRNLLIKKRGGLFPNSKDFVIHIEYVKPVQITNYPVEFKDDMEALAAVLVDYNYDGKIFNLSAAFFADEVKEKSDAFKVRIESEKCGEKICVIYLDILGNEKIEVIKKSDFK